MKTTYHYEVQVTTDREQPNVPPRLRRRRKWFTVSCQDTRIEGHEYASRLLNNHPMWVDYKLVRKSDSQILTIRG